MSRDISYLVGNMFHGTRVGDARLISGLRPDGKPQEEPVHRTSFNVGGTKETNYPKRFGPGLYLTDTKVDAKAYADSLFNERTAGGAVVEGKVTPDSPVHLTEDEFDDIGMANSSQNLVRRLQARDPKFFFPVPRPRKASFSEIQAVNKTKNFNDMPDAFKNRFNIRAFEDNGMDDNHPKMPFINNDTMVTGAHRAAANLQLRDGHDYLHITSHQPLYDDKDSQYGIVLRPNIRGKSPIFKPRAVHFFDGLESAARTEELK